MSKKQTPSSTPAPTLSADQLEALSLAEKAVQRAQKWMQAAQNYPEDPAARLLAGVLSAESGLDFTVSFVDKVIRPEDLSVAAAELSRLSRADTSFLPWYLRFPFKVGGALAPFAPRLVIPLSRKIFAALVGDLVLDVSPHRLPAAIARLRAGGAKLNMNLLGEAVLGDREASKRLRDTAALLERDDVDYVSLKVSAVTGPFNHWAYDEMVEMAVSALLPLYRRAAEFSPRKFINLDMEEYKDLHLTIDVFKRLLDTPGLERLSAGIVIQTYLPDALEAMQELQEWAAKRVAAGGARIKVRVVKGANLSMELVESYDHGWPLTVQASKQDTDSNYMQVLNYALTPERTRNVKIGVAGMNLYTVAFAYELALKRGVLTPGQYGNPNALEMAAGDGVEFEMLSGMAAPQSRAVAEDTGHLLFYVPVVHPEEYDVAIAYLVRRLEENSAPQNFMSSIFELDDPEVVGRETKRFRAALENAFTLANGPRRTQNRLTETAAEITASMQDANGAWTFTNTPDSDPSLPANKRWARAIQEKIPTSRLGVELSSSSLLNDEQQVHEVIERALQAQVAWAALGARERSEIIHRAGVELSLRRAELIEVAASECGKELGGGDVEVSEAVDFCHYYAEQALDLEAQAAGGAVFRPAKLTVVTPPWNFPIAIPCGSCVSALAAGSSVIFKPAKEAARTGALVAEALWKAGVPREVLQFVQVGERELGRTLVADPRVERVILTGSIETAQLFKSWRPELGLLAETSGKNAIVVTPAADLDLAVKDIVNSAFGHCGQKCSAASLAILVGSVGCSKRFRNQLLDAVRSLVVDYPANPASQTGALCTPARGKLLRALTELAPGEKWALKPRQLDESGRLWSPGVRVGVQPGSEYHLTEYFGPVLGLIRCDTLEEAVEIQNATEYGLTAGLHSLDAEEINLWLERVEAGNVYVNRGITGAIVRRQPFGGWKRSAVGAGTKAGGPSYLYGLGSWETGARPQNEQVVLRVRALIEASKVAQAWELSAAEAADFAAGLRSIQSAWDSEFSVGHDPSGLPTERNVLRYRPVPVLVRAGTEVAPWQVLLACSAGRTAGSKLTLSLASEPDAQLLQYLRVQHIDFTVQSDEEFLGSLPAWGRAAGYDGRIRLLSGSVSQVAQALGGTPDVAIWDHPLTLNARVEMLPYLREQAVAFTNHRFGNRTPLSALVKI